MTTPTVYVFDCATGEPDHRPMDADELAVHQADQDAAAAAAKLPAPATPAELTAKAITAAMTAAVPGSDPVAVEAAAMAVLNPATPAVTPPTPAPPSPLA